MLICLFECLLIRFQDFFISDLLLAKLTSLLFGFLHPHTFSETLFSFQGTTSLPL